MSTQDARTAVLVVLCLIGLPFAYYWINVARRKRQIVRYKFKRVVVSEVVCIASFVILMYLHYNQYEAIAFGFVAGIAASFLLVRQPRRNRRIPRYVREAVIARDLKGLPFDPSLHQLDHIVPFSKGGDHSVQNLRVVPKQENLRRGAKMPRLRDFR
jgi:HNH endonuclease